MEAPYSSETDQVIEISINSQEEIGVRLDTFLAKHMKEYSRGGIQKLIRSGSVTVNNALSKPSYQLKLGDLIICQIWKTQEDIHLQPANIPIEILYEDEHIVVVNKPSGMVVHPGAGNKENTLVHVLLYRCGKLASIGAPERPGIVHRLDQGTSGVMVAAKTNEAYLGLIDQFKSHIVKKIYHALVWGVPDKREGFIHGLMGRHYKERKKMVLLERLPRPPRSNNHSLQGKESATKWKVVKKWNDFALLEAIPITGRTHQIRVHLSNMNHPIVGDKIYGKHEKRCTQIVDHKLKAALMLIDHQMLHASTLSFYHPVSDQSLEFSAPLPFDMVQLISILNRPQGL